MKINNITMKNFRQYKDVTINFLSPKEYNLHSIIGQNGTGKTNLLNAINWCLYETEPHLGLKNGILPTCNTSSITNNKKSIVSVSLEVIDEEGIKTIFERSKEYVGKGDNYIEKPSNFDIFRMLSNKGTLDKIINLDDKQLIINKLFPESISSYFFFDGEKLDKYFKVEHMGAIKNNILQITNLNSLLIIDKNLNEIFIEKRKESSGKGVESAVVNKNIEDLEQNLENLIKMHVQIKNDRIKSKERIAEINEILRGIEDIKSLEENRKIYNENLIEKENEIINSKKNIFNFIREYSILIRLFPKMRFLLSKINEKEELGQLPPQIDKSILVKAIDSKKCGLCQQTLDENTIKNLINILEKLEYSNKTSHILTEFRPILRKSIRNLKEYSDTKEGLLKTLNIKEEERRKLSIELEKINNILLSRTDNDNIISLQTERSDLEDAMEQTIKKEIKYEEDINSLGVQIKTKEKELKRILEQEENNKILINEQEFIKISSNIIRESYEELLDNLREKIRQETEKTFFDLMWKKNVFGRIELDNKFNLKLYNNYNLECLGSCSAAERALLALSFTLALHKISGFETPLVIDTPISRVSDKNRENFAKVLKQVSLKKQIIFLFTPSEYSEEISLIFDKITATKINLNSKDDVETVINKGDQL